MNAKTVSSPPPFSAAASDSATRGAETRAKIESAKTVIVKFVCTNIERAKKVYLHFKETVVARLPREAWQLTSDEVLKWVTEWEHIVQENQWKSEGT